MPTTTWMLLLSAALQVALAVSVFYVWGLNYATITAEWPEYGLPDWVRVVTGIAKLSAAVLLIIGTWVPMYIVPAALLMGAFMSAALLLHVRNRDSLEDTLPSAVLTGMAAAILALNWR